MSNKTQAHKLWVHKQIWQFKLKLIRIMITNKKMKTIKNNRNELIMAVFNNDIVQYTISFNI